MTGKIHSFETLGTLDGPGIRLIIFMSGCNLRCQYCHNPDSWHINGGEEYSVEQIMKKIERYRSYFGDDGGITLSGGEPLLQTDFIIELFTRCREKGINTCLDTSGSVFDQKVKEVLQYTDLLLLDVKHTVKEKYRDLTGGDIQTPTAFLNYCRQTRQKMWIRQVIVPGYTDTDEYIESMLQYIEGANVERIELLPYHKEGIYKWQKLGLTYLFNHVSIPDEEKLAALRKKCDIGFYSKMVYNNSNGI